MIYMDKPNFDISKEDLEALKQLDTKALAGVSENVANKILDLLQDPANVDMFTDLNEKEIRTVCRCWTVGVRFNDTIKKEFVKKYIRLRRSKDGKRIAKLEDALIARTSDEREMMKHGIFDRVKSMFGFGGGG